MLIKNTTKKIIGTRAGDRAITLRPGTNDVKPADWEALRTTKLVAGLLESGDIIEPAEATPAAAPQVTNLEAFNEKEAIKLVKSTLDPMLLELWAQGEKRSKVMKAIEAQTKEIAPPAPKSTTGELGDDEGDNGEPPDEA